MIKKYLIIIAAVCASICASAQSYDGTWYRYPVFNDAVDKVVDTGDKVYYRSGSSLFSYSPVDNESYAYNSTNILSDAIVTDIYYNYDKEYLLVTYESGNIDLLYNDGRVINLPEIKDVVITDKKTINDVKFFDGGFAVATAFGIVIFDDEKYQVTDSGVYNKNISKITVMGDWIFLFDRSISTLYYSPRDIRHNTFDKFTEIGPISAEDFQAISADKMLISLRDNTLMLRTYTFTPDGIISSVDRVFSHQMLTPPQKFKDGWFITASDRIMTVDADGNYSDVLLPTGVAGQKIAINSTTGKVWGADADGVARYDISGSTPTVLNDKTIYQGVITCENVGVMQWSPDGRRLYISNPGVSLYKTNRPASENEPIYQTTNILENGVPRDVSVKEASLRHSGMLKHQSTYKNKRMYGLSSWLVEDPDDPSIYYIANDWEGLFVVKDGKQLHHFYASSGYPWARGMHVNIDNNGNLWYCSLYKPGFSILHADKRRAGDFTSLTTADFKRTNVGADGVGKDVLIRFPKAYDNIAVASMGPHNDGIVVYDTGGTIDDTSDDRSMHWKSVTDQDGNSLSHNSLYALTEDHDGHIWVGGTNGLYVITDPTRMFDANATVIRPKVPRNDGTNYADYLLNGTRVNWIAVDPSNRKWIATEGSGVYLVSPSGDRIIDHFDMDNSPLPENNVYAVECDPYSNTVYFGTRYGLYSYKSDAAPAQEDFSGIYAYPNPVRPDYTGWITVTGLKENSLVKITDSAGNVFFQTRSEGGMVRWDGCNAAGERVRSGVYYVYASENASGSASGAVTKIVVIR